MFFDTVKAIFVFHVYT